MGEIRIIDDLQKDYYEEVDKKNSYVIFEKYKEILGLEKGKSNNGTINIMDVGGGPGFFSKIVYEYFENNGYDIHVFVIDSARYEAWKKIPK